MTGDRFDPVNVRDPVNVGEREPPMGVADINECYNWPPGVGAHHQRGASASLRVNGLLKNQIEVTEFRARVCHGGR